MNKHELTRLAYGSTLMDGGYTLWKDEKTRLSGYVVGGVCTEADCITVATARFTELFDIYLHKLDVRNEYRTLGIGTWVEFERVFFDIVQHVDNEQDAIDMCIERGEKAYFDILAQKSIYITTEDDAVDMLYGVDNNQ
jgi:hypothetical protein